MRGFLIALVFAAQGFGLILGPLVVLGLLASGMSHSLAWRVMLALGAVPALAVFYLRRQIQETPRFTLAAGQSQEAGQPAGSEQGQQGQQNTTEPAQSWRKPARGELLQLLHGKLLGRLIGVSGTWFIMDLACYSNTVSTRGSSP